MYTYIGHPTDCKGYFSDSHSSRYSSLLIRYHSPYRACEQYFRLPNLCLSIAISGSSLSLVVNKCYCSKFTYHTIQMQVMIKSCFIFDGRKYFFGNLFLFLFTVDGEIGCNEGTCFFRNKIFELVIYKCFILIYIINIGINKHIGLLQSSMRKV